MDDEDTWITSAEMRYQQLLKKGAGQKIIVSEKYQDVMQPILPKTPSEKENKLKAGISCKLCYIVTPDNVFMEQHLMGTAHLRNVEKEAKKYREEIQLQKSDCVSQRKASVSNEPTDAIVTSNGKASLSSRNKLHDGTETTVIEDRNIKDDSHCGETVIKDRNTNDDTHCGETVIKDRNTNDDTHCGETVIKDRNFKDDTHCGETYCGETLSGPIKNEDSINEGVKDRSETADDMNNTDCEFCNYFKGDIGQTPEHFCQNFYKVPELPTGWTEKVSRTSGRPYYINNVSKERQWEWPAQPAINELPQAWVEKKAKSSGRPFYINEKTGEWQWNRPTKLPQSKVFVDFSVSTSSKETGKLVDNSSGQLPDNSLGKLTLDSAVKLSDKSPLMTKTGMIISKLKVSSSKSEGEIVISNDIEEAGEMMSKLNKSNSTNPEDQLKLDLMHWKQATEQWNNI